MENRASHHWEKPGGIVDVQDDVLCLGSLKLKGDGDSVIEDDAPQSNNASSSSPSTVEEVAADGKDSKKIKNQSDVAQETSDRSQWLLGNSVSDHGSIWGYQFFVTEGKDLASNEQGSLKVSKDYEDGRVDLCKQENLDAGSSRLQPRMQSFCCYPSMSNCVSQFESNPIFLEDSRFRPTALFNYENYQFHEITNDGVCYGNGYGATNNDLASSLQWNQQEIDTLPEGTPRIDLSYLREILEGGDREQIDMVIFIFQGSYLQMMTDKKMFVVFHKLLDACRGEQLNFLVEEVLSWSQSFIDAAFCKLGANSIIRLIKKLKKSNHAFRVTQVLSTRFFDIMTHDAARDVIQHCFIYFGNQPNKILYEKAIYHVEDLAIHKVGCRALNETINTIAGEQRSRLLSHIADCAAFLSNDPYGNYVVQNALSLKNQDVSARTVLSLQGQFIQLATKTGGSHVVEKCMESSDHGLVTVVQEILDIPDAPFRLAQDNFGNYVIQRALKKTKLHGFTGLYDSLVKSLQPYCEALNRTAGGKNVLNLLKGDGQLKWQTSICGKDGGTRRWVWNAKNSMV